MWSILQELFVFSANVCHDVVRLLVLEPAVRERTFRSIAYQMAGDVMSLTSNLPCKLAPQSLHLNGFRFDEWMSMCLTKFDCQRNTLPHPSWSQGSEGGKWCSWWNFRWDRQPAVTWHPSMPQTKSPFWSRLSLPGEDYLLLEWQLRELKSERQEWGRR